MSRENILILDTHRHRAWHLLFRNMDFKQVISLLGRCLQMKTRPGVREEIPFDEIEFDGVGLS